MHEDAFPRLLICVQTGADPHRFPPFYGNRSGFHNEHIFNNSSRTFQLEIWKMVWTNVFFFQFPGITQKPGKGNFRELKPRKIPGGASGLPQKLAPLAPGLGNRSAFILDPRLIETTQSLLPETCIRQTSWKNGHLEMDPTFLSSLYQTDISIRRTSL